MRTFVTTEQHLVDILNAPASDVRQKIVRKQHRILLSTISPDDTLDLTNRSLLNLHKTGVQIFPYSDFVNNITKTPEKLKCLSIPILYLDIDRESARDISTKYGVCCISAEETEPPFILRRGWDIETTDPDKEKSWDFLFKNVDKRSNSAVIVDRYLFASMNNKRNDDPDDNIEDSFDNLEAIISNILPAEFADGLFTITIVFSKQAINSGIRGRKTSFEDVVKRIEDIRTNIDRPYSFDIEVIALDNGSKENNNSNKCFYYNDTHDRFVITNYYVIEATHMLKAFRKGGISLTKQKIALRYAYSAGMEEGDISSIPAMTQERVIECLVKLITEPDNIVNNCLVYALNGEIKTIDYENPSKNRLLGKN